MKSSHSVKDLGENEDNALIVAVPSNEVKPAVWKKEPEFVYAVYNDSLFFVNRERAINQLNEIHESNYNRAVKKQGREWVIPIADNIWGIGKSDFGGHYILKSKMQWGTGKLTDFQKTLCSCRTVIITLTEDCFVDRDENMEKIMLEILKSNLEDMFEVKPISLTKEYQDTKVFLKELVKDVGPLFIVLDEIGVAFGKYSSSDIQKREVFLRFCSKILRSWLLLDKVFFLLLGRGSFLSYVGQRKDEQIHPSSPAKFQRLSIHLLRTDAIKLILKKTLMKRDGTQTIQQFFQLDEEKLSEVSNKLFLNTNGHPRTLLDVLKNSKTVSDLTKDCGPPPIPDLDLFYDIIFRYLNVVKILLRHLENGEPLNLMQKTKDAGGKEIPYDLIASQVLIAWEGTMEEATLFADPFIRDLLNNNVFILKEYLESIRKTPVSIDNSNVFEWIFLKRFQDLFSSSKKPSLALQPFFDTPIFGNLENLRFSRNTLPLPKITEQGKSNPNLYSETATPDSWPALLSMIDNMDSISLKPKSKSASSDAFLISKIMLESKLVTVTVGLAVKNFATTPFSENDLERECHLFNRMFDGTDCQDRKNILIICCTNYQKGIFKKFKKKLFQVYVDPNFKNIHEVIILDLTNPQNRAMFLDLNTEQAKRVESIICKPEREHSETK